MQGLLLFFAILTVAFIVWAAVAINAFGDDFMASVVLFMTLLCFLITMIVYDGYNTQTNVLEKQKLMENLGYTTLTNDEVYNTSKADLDKLLKIGTVYYHNKE